jgi:hypothetical protein
MFLVFAVLAVAIVIYQFAKGGFWDRGWHWHERVKDPKGFWVVNAGQLLLAGFFAWIHFWGPQF